MLAADAPDTHSTARRVRLATAAAGLTVFTIDGLGLVPLALVVGVPTALFVAVYVASMAAATRLLPGRMRALAAAATVAVATVLLQSGWALLAVLAVAAMPRRFPEATRPRPAHAGLRSPSDR